MNNINKLKDNPVKTSIMTKPKYKKYSPKLNPIINPAMLIMMKMFQLLGIHNIIWSLNFSSSSFLSIIILLLLELDYLLLFSYVSVIHADFFTSPMTLLII